MRINLQKYSFRFEEQVLNSKLALKQEMKDNRDRHLFSFKIGELFKMDYSAVSQAAKRFEQKIEVNDEIKEVMQRVITALKEV